MFSSLLETYNTNILRIFITISIIVLLIYIVILLRNMRIVSKINKRSEETIEQKPSQRQQVIPRLSLQDIEDVLNRIISEIITAKYLLKYRMTDKITMPDFEEETKKITEEVINSLGTEFVEDLIYFYSEEFICATVTRKVQIFLIDYLDKYKPKVH